MDVRRAPGIDVIFPGIRAWTNGQEAIDAISIGEAATHAKEVWIERSRPLIPFMEIAARGVCLPDFQQRVWYWVTAIVQDTTRDNDTLSNCLASSSRIACQIGIFRCDGTNCRAGTSQLRDRQGYFNEWKRRGTAAGGLIGFIQIGWEHLAIS